MNDNEKKVLQEQLKRARELPAEHLECRSLGHSWQQVLPDQVADHGETLAYQCARCLTVRYDVVSPRFGELLSRAYRHVVGYIRKTPSDGTRIFSAASLRAERVRRRNIGGADVAPLKPMTPIDTEEEGEE